MVGFAIVLLFSHSTAKNSTVTTNGWMGHLWDCGWHYRFSLRLAPFGLSLIIQPVTGRGEGVSPLQPSQVTGHGSQVPQSPLLPACANRAIAGTIRVLDPVTLTGKEGA